MTTPTFINLNQIDDNPYQPRLTYDETAIAEIAASILANGLLQAPVARRVGDRYQLAFGHRRKRAYDLLAQTETAFRQMPLVIRALDDLAMCKQTWTENRDRRDISAYEEACAIQRYMQAFGWNHKQVAEELGLDRSTVTNKLSLLRMPQAIVALFASGELSERQAMALKPLAELPESVWEQCNVRLGNESYPSLTAALPALQPQSADKIRETVNYLLDQVTVRLDKAPWADMALVADGIIAANCQGCPARLKSSNRCPIKSCADKKTAAYRIERAAAAAATAGLPAVSAEKYGDYDMLFDLKAAQIKELKSRGCSNLGVAWLSYGSHAVAGHEGCYIVCNHGSSGKCRCKSLLTKQGSDAQRKKALRKQIEHHYLEPATSALTGMLNQVPAGLLRVLIKRVHPGTVLSAQTALGETLAQLIIKAETKYHQDDDETGYRTTLETLLGELSIAVPWSSDADADTDLTEQIAELREHIEEAQALAEEEVPMADYMLQEAEKIVRQIAAHKPETAEAYQRQIEAIRSTLEPHNQSDVCAQTSATEV